MIMILYEEGANILHIEITTPSQPNTKEKLNRDIETSRILCLTFEKHCQLTWRYKLNVE